MTFRKHSNSKVPFPIASAVQSKAQEVTCLRAFTSTLACVPIRVPTKFNELGLLRLQGQTEFTQPPGECFLSARSIRMKERNWKHCTNSSTYRTMQASLRSRGLATQFAHKAPLCGHFRWRKDRCAPHSALTQAQQSTMVARCPASGSCQAGSIESNSATSARGFLSTCPGQWPRPPRPLQIGMPTRRRLLS